MSANWCPLMRAYCKTNCMWWERIPQEDIEKMPDEQKPHPKNPGRCKVLDIMERIAPAPIRKPRKRKEED